MNKQNVKLDAAGRVDVAYYMRLAHEQRSEYIAEQMAALVAKVKSLFQGGSVGKLSPSH
ncbi:RSP_7527 family protein [Marinobacter sp. CHS3-4]|uniref:RSP_7527 family protein n=1 Tax=Marinobacter sp. CHS3-4 TaxID=3045174 RepID=UPI0024B4A7F1|nr:hypothetical protein [Marinobacter sp. CHS3-4]MDI9243868.1 hypothetical protein [Marinobacter sp. CHS3-4]